MIKKQSVLAIFLICPFNSQASDVKPTEADVYLTGKYLNNPLLDVFFKKKNPQIIKYYIEKGGEPNVIIQPSTYTLLELASKYGDSDTLNYLLAHGAKPSKTILMDTVRFNAAEQINPDKFHSELEGQEGLSTLEKIVYAHDQDMMPATQGKIKIINEIFKRKLADINERHVMGKTALYDAVESSGEYIEYQEPIIATLLKNGARIDIADENGKTVLDILEKNPTSDISKIKLVGIKDQPTFFEAWFKADSKEERGLALMYLFNAIKEQMKDNTKQKDTKELLENFKKFFESKRYRVSEYVRERIDQKIKELK